VAAELRPGGRERVDGWSVEGSLDELALLADTAGARVVGQAAQRLERPNPSTYIGRGKVREIASQRSSLGYTTVIFDDELSPSQQRTLEKELDVKVLDRTALILDVFAQHARTREGRRGGCRWNWLSTSTSCRGCGVSGPTWSGWRGGSGRGGRAKRSWRRTGG
jgi:hypothetical protein